LVLSEVCDDLATKVGMLDDIRSLTPGEANVANTSIFFEDRVGIVTPCGEPGSAFYVALLLFSIKGILCIVYLDPAFHFWSIYLLIVSGISLNSVLKT
jgi:hypothetical protein